MEGYILLFYLSNMAFSSSNLSLKMENLKFNFQIVNVLFSFALCVVLDYAEYTYKWVSSSFKIVAEKDLIVILR